jgi:dihydroxyacetone kinase-like predicted kinase
MVSFNPLTTISSVNTVNNQALLAGQIITVNNQDFKARVLEPGAARHTVQQQQFLQKNKEDFQKTVARVAAVTQTARFNALNPFMAEVSSEDQHTWSKEELEAHLHFLQYEQLG